MSQINQDSTGQAGQKAGERSSKSGLFEILIAEFGRLKRIAAGMGLSAADAEDVLQDVSIKALQRVGEYRTESEAIHWLVKVTVNRCLTEHRRHKCFRRSAAEILKRRAQPDTGPTQPVDETIAAEELEIVREALQELDESLLMPLVLRYFCDLKSKEIGEILAVSPSTARSRLRRGRMILAKRLIERGIEP